MFVSFSYIAARFFKGTFGTPLYCSQAVLLVWTTCQNTGKFKILADQNTDLLIFILEKITTAPARLGKILAEPEMQNTDGANFKKLTKTQKCSRNGSPWLENQL